MLVLYTILILLWSNYVTGADKYREQSLRPQKRWGAIVVTLAGTKKLSDYFEWSCRSIASSEASFDMIVFHEGNTRLKEIFCAKNVKFIDLGENGLSKLIVSEVLGMGNSTNEANRGELTNMLSEIVLHIPRYLIEIKPMTGSIFKDWLSDYTHWTYTDPDIVWGNLTSWIDLADAERFDLLTLAKSFDAGRLFVRGQFALHKNIDEVNHLWKELDYFAPDNFAKRLANAIRSLRLKKNSDFIFAENFNSAEGFYSDVVFKSKLDVKIIGRGFDDFNSDPVLLSAGRLFRCKFEDLVRCIEDSSKHEIVDVYRLPAIQTKTVESFHHISACYMQWLPVSLRYCIASATYSKETALNQASQSSLRLQRVGEAFTNGPGAGKTVGPDGQVETRQWYVNDEKAARRQSQEGAFFHFRHWDDFASVSMSTSWAPDSDPEHLDCMVLYLREDKVMAFEHCALVISTVETALAEAAEGKGYFNNGGKTKAQEEKDEIGALQAKAESATGRRQRGAAGDGPDSPSLSSRRDAGRQAPEERRRAARTHRGDSTDSSRDAVSHKLASLRRRSERGSRRPGKEGEGGVGGKRGGVRGGGKGGARMLSDGSESSTGAIIDGGSVSIVDNGSVPIEQIQK